MFVLELTYTAPFDRVEAVLEQHVTWVEQHFAAGHFLVAGVKQPRDGGIVIASVDDRATAEKITQEDPFVVAGVCEYRITEFIATKTTADLASYREQPPT
ncbi:YciI family protein [Streptomyces violens]|uniref:YciI family protein n=1 Tax=Streptomyces violens TaxID=66377 RepID=UPI0004C0C417|nr:YciI family protein [Streptomyces violens]